jgi:type IV pilus assembly protein PilV
VKRKPQGFGIVEVMVTMLIIAYSLLGLAALQARAQQAELEAYQRSQSLILANDMGGRLRANHTIADCYAVDGHVGSGVAAPACTGFAASARRDQVDDDLVQWVDALNGAAEQVGDATVGSITGARGCIVEAAPNTFLISVAWLGMTPTVAPENACGAGEYGDDDRLRRVVSTTVRIATLEAM